MKKLIATLSLVLFVNQATAETTYYRGYKAELILMYGEVLRTFDYYTSYSNWPSDRVAHYHIKLMPEAYNKMRSEQMPQFVTSIFQGIYFCKVDYDDYLCVRDIAKE